MCYMSDMAELLDSLTRVASETDQRRARASAALRDAVGNAADQGLTQTQIAQAIGRSQPEVSRLIRTYRATHFRPRSPLGHTLSRHRDDVLALAQAHKARNVRVFGSLVHGNDDADSDIDLLVDLEPGADLVDLATLDAELEALLGHPVDIVPTRMLRPHVAGSALADAVEL